MALPALNQEIEQQLHDLSRTGSCVDPKDILEVVESVFASISGDHASLNHRLHADIEALLQAFGEESGAEGREAALGIPETPETPERTPGPVSTARPQRPRTKI